MSTQEININRKMRAAQPRKKARRGPKKQRKKSTVQKVEGVLDKIGGVVGGFVKGQVTTWKDSYKNEWAEDGTVGEKATSIAKWAGDWAINVGTVFTGGGLATVTGLLGGKALWDAGFNSINDTEHYRKNRYGVDWRHPKQSWDATGGAIINKIRDNQTLKHVLGLEGNRR